MARKIEFMRKSEARIIVYLLNAARHLKHGGAISDRLKIDYIYTMKILGQMYNKGWIATHKFDGRTYFRLTIITPIKEAKKKMSEAQLKLKNDD
jgi:DNA-binding MarR family transcriptional regulator